MSLKKAKDYLGNDLQVDSAIKDSKGQVIHKTYIKKTIPDGTIAKNIGVDSNGDIVKETPSSGGMSNPMNSQGDIIIGGSSGTPTRLPKGTAGQVLTMNDGATAPEWKTPSGGGGTQLYKHSIYLNSFIYNIEFISPNANQITNFSELALEFRNNLAFGGMLNSFVAQENQGGLPFVTYFMEGGMTYYKLFYINDSGTITQITNPSVDSDTVTPL